MSMNVVGGVVDGALLTWRRRPLAIAVAGMLLAVACTAPGNGKSPGSVSAHFRELQIFEFLPERTAIVSLILEPSRRARIASATVEADEGVEAEMIGFCRLCIGSSWLDGHAQEDLDKNLITERPFEIHPKGGVRAVFHIRLTSSGKAILRSSYLLVQSARFKTTEGTEIVARYPDSEFIVCMELPKPWPRDYRSCPR